MSAEIDDVRHQVASGRIGKLKRLLQENEVWRDCLLDIQTDLDRQRKTLEGRIAKAKKDGIQDPWDRLERERDEVLTLLDAIVRGNDSGNFAGLMSMVVERGLAPLPGQRHPMAGRYGLKRTTERIRELREEIEDCEETLKG